MNILKSEKKLAILSSLIEGCSARSVSRMTGCHLETVLKVLVESGKKCEALLYFLGWAGKCICSEGRMAHRSQSFASTNMRG